MKSIVEEVAEQLREILGLVSVETLVSTDIAQKYLDLHQELLK